MLLLAIDPTVEYTQVLAWAAAIIAALGSTVIALVSHRASKAEAKVAELETLVHVLQVEFKAFKDVAVVEVNALKQAHADMRRDVLTTEYFKLATGSQNQVINHMNEAVTELKEDIKALDKAKATHSEMNLLAARLAPPPRRSDGAYAVLAPHSSAPPPIRAKLPSETF